MSSRNQWPQTCHEDMKTKIKSRFTWRIFFQDSWRRKRRSARRRSAECEKRDPYLKTIRLLVRILDLKPQIGRRGNQSQFAPVFRRKMNLWNGMSRQKTGGVVRIHSNCCIYRRDSFVALSSLREINGSLTSMAKSSSPTATPSHVNSSG